MNQSKDNKHALNDDEKSRKRLKTVSSESEISHESKFDSSYSPMDYSEVEKYKKKEVIYDLPLSSCQVQLVAEEGSEKLYVKKIINKEVLNDTTKAMARKECVIHSQMNHKHIVKLHKFAESPSTIELVMDYCNKSSYFEDRLEESSDPIEDMELLKKYAREAFEALVYIHSKGIIHGDIKLANMGLHKESEDEEEILKIFDFGLSTEANSEVEGKAHLNHKVGTFGYMAPELKGNDILIGPEVDIWAMGICIYKMCVGYSPDKVPRFNFGSGPIPFPKRDWKKVNPEFQSLIKKCLEYEPEDRISAKDALNHDALR